MPRSQSTMTVISLGTAGASSLSSSTVGSIQEPLLFMARVNGRTPVDLNGRSLYPQSTEPPRSSGACSVDWEGRG